MGVEAHHTQVYSYKDLTISKMGQQEKSKSNISKWKPYEIKSPKYLDSYQNSMPNLWDMYIYKMRKKVS